MAFDFGSSAPVDSDPTADFLARERAAAGSLSGDAELFGSSNAGAGDKDFASSAAAFPSLDGEDVLVGAGAVPGPAAFVDDEDLLSGGASAAAPKDELSQFQSSFPELEEELPVPSAPSRNNGYSAPSAVSQPPIQQSYATDPYAQEPIEEPEAVKQWRSKQADDIARRDAEAERKKGETVSKAERDIDTFYAEYNQKKEKNIAANKEAEANFQAARQAELAEGTTWARVTKLVDLQNSQSKTTQRSGPGATDLTRFKEILLSLRREGSTAPAAAGY